MANLLEDGSVWPSGVYQIETTDPALGGPPNEGTGAGMVNIPHKHLLDRTAYLKNQLDSMRLKAGELVTVGSGGDFATINEALTVLSERRPAYVSGGFTTELRLLTGFTMAEQVSVASVNLGWISITSDDAEVPIDRAALAGPAFMASNGGYLPLLNTLFNMTATGDGTARHGLQVERGGGAFVAVGCGVRNAGDAGVVLFTGATLIMNSADFAGAAGNGLQAHGGTRVTAQGADLSGAGGACISATHGSTVHAGFADCSGGGVNGIIADRGATINAAGVNARMGASDSSSDIAVTAGGIIAANNATGGTSVTPNTLSASGIIFK